MFLKRFIFLLILSTGLITSVAKASETILVIPFENLSNRPEYNWVGESISIMLTDLLDSTTLIPIGMEERNLTYERMSLPTTTVLTRATAIKVAERSGADLVVVGSYQVFGDTTVDTVAVTARIIDIQAGHTLGNDYTISGPSSELEEIQGKLAWEIMNAHDPAVTLSKSQVVSKATSIPKSAFENYVKGLLTPNTEDRIKFLFRALQDYETGNHGRYVQATFALGHLYYDVGRYKEALSWLEKIDSQDGHYKEALFYRLAAEERIGSPKDEAIAKELIAKLPLYESFNNAGIALMKKDLNESVRLLGLAHEAAKNDQDVSFNYGYALWRAGKLSEAVDILSKIKETQDGAAYYILAKCQAKLGSSEAAHTEEEAKRLLPDYAKWEVGKIPALGRLKDHFSRAAFVRLQRSSEPATSNTQKTEQSQEIDNQLARAQGYFLANRDNEAMEILAQVLKQSPDRAEAHLLMGRIYERRANLPAAANALRAAIFWDPKMVAAHVLLGRIYLSQKDKGSAESEVKKALELAPNDRDAQALRRLLSNQK